jgi:hypothetical protein
MDRRIPLPVSADDREASLSSACLVTCVVRAVLQGSERGGPRGALCVTVGTLTSLPLLEQQGC